MFVTRPLSLLVYCSFWCLILPLVTLPSLVVIQDHYKASQLPNYNCIQDRDVHQYCLGQVDNAECRSEKRVYRKRGLKLRNASTVFQSLMILLMYGALCVVCNIGVLVLLGIELIKTSNFDQFDSVWHIFPVKWLVLCFAMVTIIMLELLMLKVFQKTAKKCESGIFNLYQCSVPAICVDIKVENNCSNYLNILLIMSGDVELNPGPLSPIKCKATPGEPTTGQQPTDTPPGEPTTGQQPTDTPPREPMTSANPQGVTEIETPTPTIQSSPKKLADCQPTDAVNSNPNSKPSNKTSTEKLVHYESEPKQASEESLDNPNRSGPEGVAILPSKITENEGPNLFSDKPPEVQERYDLIDSNSITSTPEQQRNELAFSQPETDRNGPGKLVAPQNPPTSKKKTSTSGQSSSYPLNQTKLEALKKSLKGAWLENLGKNEVKEILLIANTLLANDEKLVLCVRCGEKKGENPEGSHIIPNAILLFIQKNICNKSEHFLCDITGGVSNAQNYKHYLLCKPCEKNIFIVCPECKKKKYVCKCTKQCSTCQNPILQKKQFCEKLEKKNGQCKQKNINCEEILIKLHNESLAEELVTSIGNTEQRTARTLAEIMLRGVFVIHHEHLKILQKDHWDKVINLWQFAGGFRDSTELCLFVLPIEPIKTEKCPIELVIWAPQITIYCETENGNFLYTHFTRFHTVLPLDEKSHTYFQNYKPDNISEDDIDFTQRTYKGKHALFKNNNEPFPEVLIEVCAKQFYRYYHKDRDSEIKIETAMESALSETLDGRNHHLIIETTVKRDRSAKGGRKEGRLHISDTTKAGMNKSLTTSHEELQRRATFNFTFLSQWFPATEDQKKIEELTTKIKDLNATIKSGNTQKKELYTKWDEISKRYNETAQENRKLTNDNEEMKKKLKQLKQKEENEKETIKILENEKEEILTRIIKIEKENEKNAQIIQDLKNELQTKEKKDHTPIEEPEEKKGRTKKLISFFEQMKT